MSERKASYQYRISDGIGEEAGRHIVTCDQLPDWRVVVDDLKTAARAVREHSDLLEKFGESPHPLMLQHYREPTLSNWIACRKAGLEPDLPVRGGPDWLGRSDEILEKYGISEKEFIGILDADKVAISRVCLQLLDSMARSDQLAKEGQTHLARRGSIIPFEIVDWLIHCMLDGLEWYGIDELPFDLKALLRFRLILTAPKVDAVLRLRNNRFNAGCAAGRMLAMGRTPSFRAVATDLEVEASTVKRWFKSVEEFRQSAERYRPFYDANGVHKSIFRRD